MLKPSVQVRDKDGVLVAEFWDCLRLDPAPVQELRGLFENHLKGGGKGDLVVDLNGVAFAGSAALGGFLTLRKLSLARGGRVIFCNIDPNVREVFKVTRLDPLFGFADNEPAALALAAHKADDGQSAPAVVISPAPSRPIPSPGLRRRKP